MDLETGGFTQDSCGNGRGEFRRVARIGDARRFFKLSRAVLGIAGSFGCLVKI